MACIVRVAKLEDASRLREIYAPYIEHTAITFEYDCPSVADFSERIKTILKKYPYLVAEKEGQIVGYAYASPFHNDRTAYQWAVEASIYIDQGYHGQGIGKLLYEALEAALRAQGVLNVNVAIAYAEEGDPYLPKDSERFHEHMGYRRVGIFERCGFKFNRWYGILWMEKPLGAHTSTPPRFKGFQS